MALTTIRTNAAAETGARLPGLKNFPKQNRGPIGTLLGYQRNQSTMLFLSDPTLQIVLLTAACAGFPRIDAGARRLLAHFVVLTTGSSELSGGLGRPKSLHR